MDAPTENIYYNIENVTAMKAACEAWSNAIDSVMAAAKQYDEARAHFRKTSKEVDVRRIQELKVNPGNWEKEYWEITNAVQALGSKIDKLNSMEWKFRY